MMKLSTTRLSSTTSTPIYAKRLSVLPSPTTIFSVHREIVCPSVSKHLLRRYCIAHILAFSPLYAIATVYFSPSAKASMPNSPTLSFFLTALTSSRLSSPISISFAPAFFASSDAIVLTVAPVKSSRASFRYAISERNCASLSKL